MSTQTQSRSSVIWEGNVRLGGGLADLPSTNEGVKIAALNQLVPRAFDLRDHAHSSLQPNRARVEIVTFEGRTQLILSNTSGEPTALLTYSWTRKGLIDLSSSLWHRSNYAYEGNDEFLVLTNQVRRAGFIRRGFHSQQHICLGSEMQIFKLPDKSMATIRRYIASGEVPQFSGVEIDIVDRLKSMTDERMIYGVHSRFERKARVEGLATSHGIDLRDVARRAGLEEVLDAPDMLPLTRFEISMREKKQSSNRDHTKSRRAGATTNRSRSHRTVYQTRPDGDEQTAMAAALTKIGLAPE